MGLYVFSFAAGRTFCDSPSKTLIGDDERVIRSHFIAIFFNLFIFLKIVVFGFTSRAI